MVRARTSMYNIREILRLHFLNGLSGNAISDSIGISRPVVHKFLSRAVEAGLTWPLICDIPDCELQNVFYQEGQSIKKDPLEPDFEYIHRELKRRDAKVTLQLLWQEYKERNPDGWCYANLSKRYKKWKATLDTTMLQEHRAGDRLFVDFAGKTKQVLDAKTGELRPAQFFVATMGASNFTFAHPCWSQDIRAWLSCHVKALEFFGGVPNTVIPDNLKSGVIEHVRFEPKLNRAYRRLAEHYGFVITPARPYRPQDKGKVEAAVAFVETWLLGPLRNVDFFSMEDLETATHKLVLELNQRPFQKLSGNRLSWFESIDKPALHPLPSSPFEYEEWLIDVKVPRTYHIQIQGHQYSVPHLLAGQSVDARVTDSVVEVLHNDQRVASHNRSRIEGSKSTIDTHMPKQHREYAGQSPEKFIALAQQIGPCTCQVIKIVLDSQPYPQLAYDKCFGIVKHLKNKYSAELLESACKLALELNIPNYKSIKSLLVFGLENIPSQLHINLPTNNIEHENVRGPEYYS